MRVVLFGGMLFLFAVQTSCTTGFGAWLLGKDTKTTVIQTLNLFDQGSEHENKDMPQLAGDWIFRRERLSFLDMNMRHSKSDIFVVQQASQRRGSASDADDAILMAGALSGYDLEKIVVNNNPEAASDVLLMNFLSPPFKFTTIKYLGKLNLQTANVKALVSVSEIEKLPVVVINVDISDGAVATAIYDELGRLMDTVVSNEKICADRVVLAGSLPGDSKSGPLQSFLDRFDLVDTAPEACLELGCNTLTPDNIIDKTVDRKRTTRERLDKILVSKNADIISSSLAFDKTYQSSQYTKDLGFDEMSISKRFGWSAEVRLQKCKVD